MKLKYNSKDLLASGELGDIAMELTGGLIIKSKPQQLFRIAADAVVGNDASSGTIHLGGLSIQFGKVTKTSTRFTIDFNERLSGRPIYASVQGAGNDLADGVFNNPQIDGAVPPTETEMTVEVQNAVGGEFYYWIVIGKAR